MAINFPTSLDTLSNPSASELLENANAALDHDAQHSNANDAIEALEAKVGINSSAVTTSHDYKLSEVTGSDKGVGKTAIQTLTNKTLTSPVVNVTSDATGDLYYRNASGLFTRLPIGTSGQVLSANGSSIPEWIANPSASDGSTTTKGVFELATTAEISAGTATGATGANLVVPASAVGAAGADKLVQYTAAGLYPAANGSLITAVVPSVATKIAVSASDTTSPSDTVENTVYSQSVAGGVLSTANALRLTLYFDTFTMTSNGTFTWRFKYGGTTLATLTVASATITSGKGKAEFVLMGSGATNTQEGHAMLEARVDGVSTTNINYQSSGTAAEDSTGALNVVVTTQSQNTGTLSGVVTIKAAVLEKIY